MARRTFRLKLLPKQRQTTLFDEITKRGLHNEVKKRAANHNRLIVGELPSREQLCELLLPPQDREAARAVVGRFPLAEEAFNTTLDVGRFELAEEAFNTTLDVAGDRIHLRWVDREEQVRSHFAVPVNFAKTRLYHDAHPELAADLSQRFFEWGANAADYGFLTTIVDWLDSRLPAKDYRTAGFWLPALTPLAALVNKSVAEAMAHGARLGAQPPPHDCLEGLRKANGILTRSHLLPVAPDRRTDVVIYAEAVQKRRLDCWQLADIDPVYNL